MDLLKKLLELKENYYQGKGSSLSDQEYDALEEMFKNLEPNHPFFSTVGYNSPSIWKQTKHNIPMGSLFKINLEEEFIKWSNKFKNPLLCIQHKIDGLSVSLNYKNGTFEKAITRGDGFSGEIISTNVLMMRGLKLKLPDNFNGSIRAEIVLYKEHFNKLNELLSEKYSNPRNAAAGISRRLDGKYAQYLTLICYDITEEIDEPHKIEKLKNWGFLTTPCIVGRSKEIIDHFNNLKEKRDVLKYNIDGLVIKICSISAQKNIGVVDNRPKGQIAWKFDPPGAITTIKSVSWDIGRTGVLTPVATITPTKIEGTTIEKVTLHNLAELYRLKIGLEDTVTLIKAGEIIPKITSVLEHKNVPMEIPTHCPACKTLLINDGIRLMCPGNSCVGKNFQRILNFIKVIKIDTFGESLAEKLYEQGKLVNLVDIFALKKEDISTIEGWGDKSAETIIANINSLRKMDPAIFLSALGIPSLSTSTAEDLWRKFGTIDAIRKASVEDICTIKGYSTISATKIVEGLKLFDDQIMKILVHVELQDTNKGGKFSGMAFCFTGEMSHPRSYFQSFVTKLGGKNDSSVTKKTTFLVCNENKGSSKSRKAEQYGVKIINEVQFLDMVGEVPETEKKPKLVLKSLFEE
jgi:DNA ligase (NAD+)